MCFGSRVGFGPPVRVRGKVCAVLFCSEHNSVNFICLFGSVLAPSCRLPKSLKTQIWIIHFTTTKARSVRRFRRNHRNLFMSEAFQNKTQTSSQFEIQIIPQRRKHAGTIMICWCLSINQSITHSLNLSIYQSVSQ